MITHTGPVFDVIDATRRAVRANLIVLASHARTRSVQHAHDGVAARIMEELEVPVLVVHPDPEHGVVLLSPHDRVVAMAETDRSLIHQHSAP